MAYASKVFTYSFSSIDMNISHPSVGQIKINDNDSPNAVGQVTITMAADRTVHDVAADGAVCISRVKNNTCTITIQCQQTSPIHQWLLKWYNHVISSKPEEFALAEINISSRSTHEGITATHVTPQKFADRTYKAQQTDVTWTLMAADIITNPA